MRKLSSHIIIHDNGTTYPETLKFYKDENLKVEYSNENSLEAVCKTVKKYQKDSRYYAVTDSDIMFENDVVSLRPFIWILNKYPDIPCVGPMLELYDLPDSEYLDKQKEDHWHQFWSKTPKIERLNGKPLMYQSAWIDTTFALYRHSFDWQNLNLGVRLYHPYSARHIDWYLLDNAPPDYLYYAQHCDNRIATLINEQL